MRIFHIYCSKWCRVFHADRRPVCRTGPIAC